MAAIHLYRKTGTVSQVGQSDLEGADEVNRSPAYDAMQKLASLLPIKDLSTWAENFTSSLERNFVEDSRFIEAAESILRTLFRPGKHALLTGSKGVGKTTLVQHIAFRNFIGDSPFLKHHRFLWMDCRNVGPEDSRACLESIFSAIGRVPGIVLCLDGIASLMKKNGGSNKPLLRALINRGGLRVIGIMSSWEYNDLVSSDAEMLDYFQRVELEEPSDDVAEAIAQHHAMLLSQEHQIAIDDPIAERATALTSTFILNECQPAKTVDLLRQVCTDADFLRTQQGRTKEAIELDDVVSVISGKTGIPEATISGESANFGFEDALGDAVVGQADAVRQVANELSLIKAGLNEPGKPAGVFLFAGMTGVGKTELAKRIAELYSTSRRVQVYTMGNYTEPHSVSGIIGVPPGYVGHEDGGRIVNELNADPYSVFLLDEAEKCHPNIWKPFLNLFDEGWIVDQRGQKAHADRAIFILTTNAGDRQVSQMAKNGDPIDEISERVKQALSRVRHEKSSQPVFPPQFLARIKRIIVFNPLNEEAMVGIAERRLSRMATMWKQKREKTVKWTSSVSEKLGRRGYELNEISGGREGGRIVGRLCADIVELQIQEAAQAASAAYESARVITVDIEGDGIADKESVKLRITFE